MPPAAVTPSTYPVYASRRRWVWRGFLLLLFLLWCLLTGLQVVEMFTANSTANSNTFDDYALLLEGEKLSPAQIPELEAKVSQYPDDLPNRLRLLGYYREYHESDIALPPVHVRHILHVIQHYPERPLMDSYQYYLHLNRDVDADAYQQARAIWLKCLEKQPENPVVWLHAAEFFEWDEPELMNDVLQQATLQFTDNSEFLANLYYKHTNRINELWEDLVFEETNLPRETELICTPVQRESYIRKCHEYAANCDALRHQIDKYQREIINILDRLIKVSSDHEYLRRLTLQVRHCLLAQQGVRASELAERLLSDIHVWGRAEEYEAGQYYAYLALASRALNEQRVEEAAAYLQKAAQISAIDDLDFLPVMQLIVPLYQAGQMRAVIDYLTACRKLWPDNASEFDKLIKLMQDGQPLDEHLIHKLEYDFYIY
ncbi:MAG: hypothetical protein HJJLKODD_01622 [Phycisphaerae bacterium]|nr:hypothetical protein [Phycisphaerae bacterium]